jgi:hypothetical protein
VTSDVYAVFRREKLIDFDDVFYDNEPNLARYEEMNRVLDDGGTPNKHMSAEEIKTVQIRAYRSFIVYRAITYLYPPRLIRKIRSMEDARYLLKILRIGARFLMRTFTKNTTKALLYDYD